MLRTFDWNDIQLVKRDICFFYHLQQGYMGIDGDQPYGEWFRFPYWELLPCEWEDHEPEFVISGSLILIFGMALDILDRSGTYLTPNLPDVIERVRRFGHPTERLIRLRDVVNEALQAAAAGLPASEYVAHGSCWAKSEFILSYFEKMASRDAAINNGSSEP